MMLQRMHYEMLGCPTFLLGFGIEEIDKIMVDRICCRLVKGSLTKSLEVESSYYINDQISKLPDEILSSILSLLTMREAAATSILSQRWKDLWRTTMTLNFDNMDKHGYNYCMPKITGQDAELLKQGERCKFVSWVDQILLLHGSSRIETFRVRHCLGKEHAYHIDQWIQFALAKKVQNLELDFSEHGVSISRQEPYSLPCPLFEGTGSLLQHLSLGYCSLPISSKSSSFKSLVSLTLSSICLGQGHLETFISGCTFLEWLSMTRCSSPSSVKVVSLTLKHLSITTCSSLKEIEISATSLLSCELKGPMIQFSFKSPPQSLLRSGFWCGLDGIKYALGRLASDVPCLESLFLVSPPIIEENILPKQLPTFTKLKKLEVLITKLKPVCLLPFTCLLEASPFLQIFELHILSSRNVDEHGPIEMKRKISKFPHRHLKEVKIHGFYGHCFELEIATYFLNNAIFLERMELTSNIRGYLGDGEFAMVDERKTKFPKEVIYKLLKKEAPSSCTAQLVIL